MRTSTRWVLVMAMLACTAVLLLACGGGASGSEPVCPVLLEQPTDQTIMAGQDASFRVSVDTEGAAYQWQASAGTAWVDVPGATASIYLISGAPAGLSGSQFRAVVRFDDETRLISATATLTVLDGGGPGFGCGGSAWCRVHPQPAPGDLHAVAFDIDAGAGAAALAVGQDGILLRSTDGGATWTVGRTAPATDMRDVVYAGPGRAFAVGPNGIHQSADGGANWTRIPVAATGLQALARRGTRLLATGDGASVWHSVDGGDTWQEVAVTATTSWQAVANSDAGVALMFGSSASIFGEFFFCQRSTDGGLNWSARSPLPWRVTAAAFAEAGTVVAVGAAGHIARSTDAGLTWTEVPADALRNRTLGKVVFSSPAQAVAVDDLGRAWTSSDAGVSWSGTVTGAAAGLLGLAADGAGRLIAVGPASSVVRSGDAGASWTNAGSLSAGAVRGVAFASPSVVIASSGNNKLLRSSDGGGTWTALAVPAAAGGGYNGVAFASPDTGLVVGARGAVLRTVDGGLSFTQGTAGTADLNAAAFDGSGRVLAVGSAGTVLASSDAGLNWTDVPSGTTQTLYGVAFTRTHAVAVGASGTILRLNFASEVSVITPPVFEDLRGVAFIGDTGLAVGSRGTLLRSVDGGQNWTAIAAADPGDQFMAVQFAGNGGVTYAATLGGRILRSGDAGLTWQASSSDTTQALFALAFSSADNGVAGGNYGLLLRTSTGVTARSEERMNTNGAAAFRQEGPLPLQ